MALYFDVRKKYKNGEISQEELKERVNEAIQNLAVVLCGKWPDRFFEIEWPVLIWLNWIVGFAAHAELGDLWPNNVEEFCRVPGMAFGTLREDTFHLSLSLFRVAVSTLHRSTSFYFFILLFASFTLHFFVVLILFQIWLLHLGGTQITPISTCTSKNRNRTETMFVFITKTLPRTAIFHVIFVKVMDQNVI